MLYWLQYSTICYSSFGF